MILSTDLHLTDEPANEYRWEIFPKLMKAINERIPSVDDVEIVLLGDIFDRKDKHSGFLVNKFVAAIDALVNHHVSVSILMGNHDKPLNGLPYWKFLNQFPFVRYITEPFADGHKLYLPYSDNPKEEWKGIDYSLYRCIFMHQTVSGVVLENGIRYDKEDNVPLFPRTGLQVYSGDIHVPQHTRGITYVGAPHPIKFGDSYPTRMLWIDDEAYKIREEIPVETIKKAILEIESAQELRDVSFRAGDQIRITFNIDPDKAEQWPVEQDAILKWAQQRRVEIASLEAVIKPVEGGPDAPMALAGGEAPEDVLTAYSASEGLDDDRYETGMQLLRDGINAYRSS